MLVRKHGITLLLYASQTLLRTQSSNTTIHTGPASRTASRTRCAKTLPFPCLGCTSCIDPTTNHWYSIVSYRLGSFHASMHTFVLYNPPVPNTGRSTPAPPPSQKPGMSLIAPTHRRPRRGHNVVSHNTEFLDAVLAHRRSQRPRGSRASPQYACQCLTHRNVAPAETPPCLGDSVCMPCTQTCISQMWASRSMCTTITSHKTVASATWATPQPQHRAPGLVTRNHSHRPRHS